jgi:ribosome-binding protein aMBF1 (putative translation factor)
VLARYQAALGAGAGPQAVARWTGQVEAHRDAVLARDAAQIAARNRIAVRNEGPVMNEMTGQSVAGTGRDRVKGKKGKIVSEVVYNRIAMLRAERGVSRRQLAEALGVHYQTIGYLERSGSPSISRSQ